MYDVLIVGGGAAGYGCALTLASVRDRFDWSKDKKYLMIDAGESDILKASFFNLTGVAYGIGGDDLNKYMEAQLAKFENCTLAKETVTKVERAGENFKVTTGENSYEAAIVVLATGMHKFDIECELTRTTEHEDVLKPNKICLKHSNNQIADGLYVAGLASGVKTMFAIANGDGAKVACDIFKLWTGKPAVAHDTIKDKIQE